MKKGLLRMVNSTPQKVDINEVANFISWAHLKLQVGTMFLEDCLKSGNLTPLKKLCVD